MLGSIILGTYTVRPINTQTNENIKLIVITYKQLPTNAIC